jgi:hypothetical protein
MAKNTVPQTASGQAQYASGYPVVGAGKVAGIIITTHSSGTLKLVDSPNSQVGRVIMETWTLASGPQTINFPAPLDFYEGVNVALGGSATFELVIIPE